MQVLESTVEKRVVRWCKRNGVKVKLKMSGERLDRWFLLPGGAPFIVEFKRLGKKPSRRQSYEMKKLKELGYDVEDHDNADVTIDAIKKRLDASSTSAKSVKVFVRQRSGCAISGPGPRQN